jgi:hypothetical protein
VYYVRAYATNSVGTAYGSQVSFTTLSSTQPLYQVALRITNQQAVSPTVYEFDVFLQNTGLNEARFANLQFGLGIDTSLLNGGTLTVERVSNTTQLSNANQLGSAPSIGGVGAFPTGGTVYRWINQSGAAALTDSSLSSIIPSAATGCASPGVRFARYRVINSVPFKENMRPNHVFATTAASGRSRVAIGLYTAPTAITTYVGMGIVASGTQQGVLIYNYNTPGTCDVNPTLAKMNATVKVLLEGAYIGNGEMLPALYDIYVNNGLSLADTPDPDVTDTLTISLWDPADLSVPVYSQKHVLRTNSECDFSLPGSYSGQSYWISVNHRSSLEIWSSSAVAFSNNVVYDFTSNLTNTFNDGFTDPQIETFDGKYVMISGDVNQDGNIEGADANQLFSSQDANVFDLLLDDITFDGYVDLVDYNQGFTNSGNSPFFARPY